MARIIFGNKEEFIKMLDAITGKKRYNLFFVGALNPSIIVRPRVTSGLDTLIFEEKTVDEAFIEQVNSHWQDEVYTVKSFEFKEDSSVNTRR